MYYPNYKGKSDIINNTPSIHTNGYNDSTWCMLITQWLFHITIMYTRTIYITWIQLTVYIWTMFIWNVWTAIIN